MNTEDLIGMLIFLYAITLIVLIIIFRCCCSRFPLLLSNFIFSIIGFLSNIGFYFYPKWIKENSDSFFVVFSHLFYLLWIITYLLLLSKKYSQNNDCCECWINIGAQFFSFSMLAYSFMIFFSGYSLNDENKLDYSLPHPIFLIINIFCSGGVFISWASLCCFNEKKICCSGCICDKGKATNEVANNSEKNIIVSSLSNINDNPEKNNAVTEKDGNVEIIEIKNEGKKKENNNEHKREENDITIIFRVATWKNIPMSAPSNITVKNLLICFLKKLGIESNDSSIKFTHGGENLRNFGEIILKEIFRNDCNITVNDPEKIIKKSLQIEQMKYE